MEWVTRIISLRAMNERCSIRIMDWSDCRPTSRSTVQTYEHEIHQFKASPMLLAKIIQKRSCHLRRKRENRGMSLRRSNLLPPFLFRIIVASIVRERLGGGFMSAWRNVWRRQALSGGRDYSRLNHSTQFTRIYEPHSVGNCMAGTTNVIPSGYVVLQGVQNPAALAIL